jgi:hypothetical protein
MKFENTFFTVRWLHELLSKQQKKKETDVVNIVKEIAKLKNGLVIRNSF